jgi:dCTP deaminase
MTTLGTTLIESALNAENPNDRLFVTPILDRKQIGGASIDVRLGFDFVTVKRGNVGVFDPAASTRTPGRFRSLHLLNLGSPFYLHPNEMALASTLEYVRLPLTLSAYVTSRSKWGRLGLVIATATAIHPEFTGTITLELVNHGNVPLVLYPGLAVAQIIFHRTEGATPYTGTLSNQVGPLASDVVEEQPKDIKFWLNQTPDPKTP